MPERKTLLVVDDDPEICEALQEILTDYGYHVLATQDTITAQRVIEDKRPDLLILDIMMATMDEGLNFATMIKRKEGVWSIPILMVSARPPVEEGYSRSVDQDLDWIHADIFMEKPVDPEDLVKNIQILLKEAR